MYLPNNQSKIVTNRGKINFNESCFSEELLSEIEQFVPLNKNITIFDNVCISFFERYTHEKQKYIRVNLANVMDTKLNHAIKLSSRLCTTFLKSRCNKDRETYKQGQNLCVSVLCQNKKDYFESLDIKYVTDNKKFGKTVAQLFSSKSKASNKTTLSENEKLIIND